MTKVSNDKDTMTELQKIVLLLSFYYNPWYPNRETVFKGLTDGGYDFDDDGILNVIEDVVTNDDGNLDWDILNDFKRAQLRQVGIVTPEDSPVVAVN